MTQHARLSIAVWLALCFFSAQAQELTIEAESGTIAGPFLVTNSCIFQPATTAITNGGRAEYALNLAAGSYAVQILVNAPAGSSNVLAVAFDAEPQDPASAWDVPATSGFESKFVGSANPGRGKGSPTFFELNEGAHKLILRGSGANVRIDRLMIFKKPAPPRKARIRIG